MPPLPANRQEVSIRPVISLGFLAACAPTVLLFALRSAVGLWHDRAALAVLSLSGALICGIITVWLARECKLSGHPGLAILSDGFAGVGFIFVATSQIDDGSHMTALRVFSMIWATVFGTLSVILLNWKSWRRGGRQLLARHPLVFHSLSALLFTAIGVCVYLLDKIVFQPAGHALAVRIVIFAVSGLAIPILLVASFRTYQRKRNPVILFFSLALYLHALSILGQTMAVAWSLQWWFGQGLGLLSVFSIAYGVVEANRVRDRWELIQTLAARSDELQKSHENLVASEARYRSLVDNAPNGIFRVNGSDKFDAVNPALLEMLGYSGAGSPKELPACSSVFSSRDDYEEVMNELRERGRFQDAVFWKNKDGKTLKVRLECRRTNDADSTGSSYEGIVEDLSEQNSLEEQLRHSQKMEAIGRLAGGIAHDFNNLLTIISGYTGMLMDTLADQDPRRADAERVKNASQRAAALTRQLLAFSRKQVLSPATLNLNDVVGDFSKMLPRLLGEDIDLAFIPSPQHALVYADRGQVEQVLMNLVVNARDAMPDGGKITIEIKLEKLEQRYARRRRGVIAGEYVMLAVTDTGRGMDAATQARIFEPFFTTKEEGKGTGLGLATAYGIVKQSGGHIVVYSEPGQGSTFKVYFPATAISRRPQQELVANTRLARGETVLVVEDESDLRTMIVRALDRLNYKIIEAATAEEALELVENYPDPIHLLLTDVVMPGLRGTQLAPELVRRLPDLKVLYMSGYTDNAMFHQKLLTAGASFIQKPFTLDALEEKVGKILDSGKHFAAAAGK